MTPLDEHSRLGIGWLVRIRWLAALGQAAVLATTWFVVRADLPYAWLILVVALTPLSNLLVLSPPLKRVDPDALVKATVVLDLVLLTALLALSGGPANPFTVVYLVHTALGAVMLGQKWTWIVALLSSAGFAFVFFVHLPVHALMHHSGPGANLHLEGMWVAFAITSASIAFFVARLASALKVQRDALAEAAARADRLGALTTLATGAAHELGSPLATIAVSARELSRSPDPDVREDAELIRAEVERCREILQDMSHRAGSGVGEAPTVVSGAEFSDLLGVALGQAYRAVAEVRVDPELRFTVVPRSFVRIVANLVRNAAEASPPGAPVAVSLDDAGGGLRVVVSDRGSGMTADVLARAGQPFFTTRPPGAGLGLGLFLARTYADSFGGTLLLESEPGRGTRVQLDLPGAIS
jgi:two-component system sensor histidine kinase RegB